MVGPDKDGSLLSCKQYVKNKSLDVTFTGLLTKEQWCNISTSRDIFINTSSFDNMPVTLIEAAALGMPIISTPVGGIPFMIEDGFNGLLAHDVTQMHAACLTLLEDPLLVNKLSKNGRKHAEQFDWDVVKEKWNHLLTV